MSGEFLKFLELTINGLNTGMLYGLIAIGYTMVYGIIQLINFAHGEVCMLGAMFTVTLMGWYFSATGGDPSGLVLIPTALFFVCVTLSCMGDGLFGIALDKVAYKPLRGSSRLSALITAIGMSLLLQNLAVIVWDASAKTVKVPGWFNATVIKIGGRLSIRITAFHLMIWVITILAMIALYYVVKRTRFGMAMRASAQNPVAASLMGIQLNKVVAVTFFIGSFLGAVGGIAVAINKGSFDYLIGLYVGVVAFAAAVLGGIGSIPGAMLGGLIIGVVEAWAAGYLSEIAHPFTEGGLSTGYKEAVGFMVLILIILLRPEGLLGTRGGDRA
jgi:branched-chain amino acid transport system permease protein